MNKIKHFWKLATQSRPFDIWFESVCEKGENGMYWLGYDNKVYYRSLWIFYHPSCQKSFRGNFINHENV
jgi:hypothetical protein